MESKIGGEPLGWWDENKILFKDKANNLGLFDVVAGIGTNMFSAQTLTKRLQGLGLSADASDIAVIRHFNGHGSDILLTLESQKNWGQAFLVKVDPSDLSFELLDRDFKFQWSGHLNADCTLYVYQGKALGRAKVETEALSSQPDEQNDDDVG